MHLEQGNAWPDGERVDAEDVCFSIDAVLDPANDVPWATEHRRVLAGCEASEDGRTATIRYHRYVPNPREWLGLAILPEHAFAGTAVPPDHAFATEAFGSFGMRADLDDDRALFTHPGGPPPRITRFEWRPEGDLADLEAGRVHGLVLIDDPEAVERNDELVVKRYDQRDVWFIAVRRHGALAGVEARRALDAAIDRERLRGAWRTGHADGATEVVTGPYAMASPYYNRSVKPRPYSSAPLDLGALRLGVSAEHEALVPGLAEGIAAQLRERGVEVEVVVVDGAVDAAAAKDLDLALLRWVTTEPEHARPLFAEDGALNPFGVHSTATDERIAEMELARTDTEYRDATHALHQVAFDEVHAVWLMRGGRMSAWRTQVRANVIGPHSYWGAFGMWKLEP